jgi:hypothetical protein
MFMLKYHSNTVRYKIVRANWVKRERERDKQMHKLEEGVGNENERRAFSLHRPSYKHSSTPLHTFFLFFDLRCAKFFYKKCLLFLPKENSIYA